MSWLQRGLFTRRRGSSQTKDVSNLKTAPHNAVIKTEDSDSDSSEALVDNVNDVFGRLSIGEVRQHEQRLQRHAERMRRQLRRVAGEHYADLMAAADSAADMSATGTQVRRQVERLAELLAATQDEKDTAAARVQNRRETSVARNQNSPVAIDRHDSPATHMYAAAAQVRVLVDTPEQVWKALAAGRFLHAALLFQIAQVIHTRLGAQSRASTTGDAGVDPLLAFPVVERQWAAVAPFRTQIAAKAQAALSSDSTDTTASTGAVCAVAFLEDADAETACALFLARRSQTLQPMLHAMCDRKPDALDTALVKLLKQVLRILHEFADIFCVPRRDRRFASRLLVTLASVCADVDFPVASSADALLPSELSTEQRNARARRRKSSVAGRVLSSTLVSERNAWQTSTKTSQPTGGAFMTAKYLPIEVAQFRPQMPRILEDTLLSYGDVLDEADEDIAGVARFHGSPDVLLRVLSTQAQPQLERAAAHALRLWWRETVDTVQEFAARAIECHVATVADATRVAAAVTRAGLAAGLPPDVDPTVCDATEDGQLYAAAVEPLLLRRARELQCATTDHALELPEAFLQGAELRDVLAGYVPWRALPSDGISLLRADIRATMDVEPPAARALADAVAGEVLAGWRDAEKWWQCLSGAAVRSEAAFCVAHLAECWESLVIRLGEWTEVNVKQARMAIESDAAAVGEYGISEVQMPHAVVLCLKGAWTACALLNVLHQITKEGPMMLREYWSTQYKKTNTDSTVELQRIRHVLLEPWLEHLGYATALIWAGNFDALYSRVPVELQSDAAATRRDVVRAWREASVLSDGGESGSWTTRYSALRRIAAASQSTFSAPSASVCSLASLLQMRVQAVAGLRMLGIARNELMNSLHAALARVMEDVIARKLSCSPRPLEWDHAQLATDALHLIPIAAVDAVEHPHLSETLAR
ncbi:hypothetical protein COEREDRAFT_93963 [Coemansia reversa NRRL 1564]|uniref:Conserved oligomeric Golgi complex subunit 1 n=1 Tax=Coemansia reversa (strain ATCC 12441 / NRRL 1564) TaxID=763665 RepID=A0A2G5B5S5_COERN|nr:hypothetical protein COEREDRAFT_93963 [Coemansia reversa NRRL 1564]|eukprot:PIA14359.1 hypothetical protein COEREDRAFT_93963 [Coemansia reversa NRRL 1564]